jgi:hypothetical protein
VDGDTIRRSSTETVKIPFTGPDAETLTAGMVRAGVSYSREVDPTEWWAPLNFTPGADGSDSATAYVLVGPGVTPTARILPADEAHFFVKVLGNPETPILYSGRLYVSG